MYTWQCLLCFLWVAWGSMRNQEAIWTMSVFSEGPHSFFFSHTVTLRLMTSNHPSIFFYSTWHWVEGELKCMPADNQGNKRNKQRHKRLQLTQRVYFGGVGGSWSTGKNFEADKANQQFTVRAKVKRKYTLPYPGNLLPVYKHLFAFVYCTVCSYCRYILAPSGTK